jgi:hypothetical protein
MLSRQQTAVISALVCLVIGIAWFDRGASHYVPSDKHSSQPKEKTQDNSKPNSGETQSLWIPNDSVGLYTLVLSVFTGVLAAVSIFQGIMLLRSDKTARIAADAAKLNAQAVIAAERAYVFVEINLENVADIINYMHDMPSVAPRPILIQYCFTNYGKTPAVIKSIGYGAVVAENLPRQREYSHVLHLPTHLLGAETSTRMIEYDEFKISAAVASSIRNLKDTFWFYGEIVYDDTFDRQKTFDFVFHVGGISEGFTLYRYEERDEKRES